MVFAKGPKKATAIGFDSSVDGAPRVLAQGQGGMAELLVGRAKDNGVTIIADPELSELTSILPVNQEIPENLYTVMAGIFGMILRVRGQLG